MLRRTGYVLIVIVWLVLMALPILAFILAARGELMIGDDQSSNIRLFMVNEDEVKGIGFQRAKKAHSRNDGCYRTSVRYLLWEGRDSNLNISYCACHDPDTGYADASRTCESR
ncbi:MAG: hypothetical protein JSW55_02850 [Chloroflexota bacterium]|nr:MAG: hypothetical protein JSW55_02850 [Chloroflexota bacterium]